MILRLLSAALAAGFLAAVVATGLQLALTSPLIIAAERFEAKDERAAHAFPIVHAHLQAIPVHEGHSHGDGPSWKPSEGLPRMAYTGLATLIGGVGYALLLGAVMLGCGQAPTPARGLAFAIAGFASMVLAPALGLPPELPGSEAAPLATRQAWWLMTAVATAMGLYLIAIRRVAITIVGGLILIVAPHLAGAPEIAAVKSELPAGLAAQFAARALAVGFVFWCVIGLAYGWAWQAFGRGRETAVRA